MPFNRVKWFLTALIFLHIFELHSGRSKLSDGGSGSPQCRRVQHKHRARQCRSPLGFEHQDPRLRYGPKPKGQPAHPVLWTGYHSSLVYNFLRLGAADYMTLPLVAEELKYLWLHMESGVGGRSRS
ncbi:hypothetical protein CRG98_002519 [Punica granatum]|uniref:Uncharacterized protein n=1 Tax=Punica granatum TaxID=22663 RepID=A0A2I0LA38_PUNGR|nr:hypothetical protein CRG98_002519 [Punica granatum]